MINNFKATLKTITKPSLRTVCSRNHKNYFDLHVDWFFSGYLPMKSLCYMLVGFNTSVFLYVNFRYGQRRRVEAASNIANSSQNLYLKETIPFFFSSLGSLRLDDLILENALLLTVAKQLEKKHGLPFALKLGFVAWFVGICSASFCVSTGMGRRERNRYDLPETTSQTLVDNSYKYLSAHGVASSFLYFYLIKNRMALVTLPLLAADMYVYGPYYINGPLAGITFGLLV